MFSGLIESLGIVTEILDIRAGRRLRVDSHVVGELSGGDSIAVNGVCLTVVRMDESTFLADISPETARVTTLGRLTRRALVNLERPCRADTRLGGHFVLGHVDAIGYLETINQESDFHRVRLRYPPELSRLIVEKGSIAVDGVSFTVAARGDDWLDIQVVPYTWTHTNLHVGKVKEAVNLECDIIGKYVVRAVESVRSAVKMKAGESGEAC